MLPGGLPIVTVWSCSWNGAAYERPSGAPLVGLCPTRRYESGLGWWVLTVYNWCRPGRALRLGLAESEGKKKFRASDPGHGPQPYEPPLVHAR